MSETPDLAVDLRDDARQALTFQDYGAIHSLHGVHYQPLQKRRGESGWFLELYRITESVVEPLESEPSHPLKQISTSWADPGRMNAFHIHPRRGQNEYWTVLQGQLLVWLVDCRRESETSGRKCSYLLSGESPGRLFIPAGVAHGYRAGTRGALLVYGMDRTFDGADPDEGRLPWDHFGVDLWERDRG